MSRIEEMLSASWRKLPSEAQESFGSPAAFGPVLAAGLRVMADETEVEPSFPMTAGLVADLIRERADDLDSVGDG